MKKEIPKDVRTPLFEKIEQLGIDVAALRAQRRAQEIKEQGSSKDKSEKIG